MQHFSVPAAAALLGVVLVASGCGSSQSGRVMGFEKAAPDEFRVVERAPLSLPPDYGLRPPAPGATRPQEVSARDVAQDIVLSSAAVDQTKREQRVQREQQRASALANKSFSEALLLRQTGALDVDPDIRRLVNREAAGATVAAERTLADRLAFWRDRPEPRQGVSEGAVVVDPAQERRRLQENAALGRSPTDGPTPVIRRKERGGLF